MGGDVTDDTEPAVDSFLEALAATDVAGLPVGSELAHYRIEQLLGRGGMGVVHRAVDVNLDRAVALKLMKSAAPTDEARERFLREARLAAALSHPNLVVIYEVGAAREGLFIAMELVDGENLRTRISRGPMSLQSALPIARSVADALSHAHSKGVVHRDLKPENILLNRHDVPKVADFGIAKALDSDLAGPTRTGAVLGTVGYMSPEQAEGAKVTDRTDVWSLGVVVYEMVTGRLPFDWRTPGQLLKMVEHARPPSIRALGRGAPRELDALIARCLSVHPGDRPSMTEVASLLARRRSTRTPRLVGAVVGAVVGAAAVATIALVALMPRKSEVANAPPPSPPPLATSTAIAPFTSLQPPSAVVVAASPCVVPNKPNVIVRVPTPPSSPLVATSAPSVETAPSPSPHRKKPGVAETPPF